MRPACDPSVRCMSIGNVCPHVKPCATTDQWRYTRPFGETPGETCCVTEASHALSRRYARIRVQFVCVGWRNDPNAFEPSRLLLCRAGVLHFVF